MKKREKKRRGIRFIDMVAYFIPIAFMIQIAVLVFDYIETKTDNKVLIAILILIVIIMLALIVTIIDAIRRKFMVYRPLGKILDATEKIANGDFSTKILIDKEYGKYNEYDVIMDNINLMADELKKNEVLKTDFISSVTHELKTPLAVINNYSSLLAKEEIDEESRIRYAKTVQQASKKLDDLISNILKLNKLENQTIKPDIARFNLTETLAQSVLAYESVCEDKGIELDCDFDDVWVYSSESMLEIVFNNLISNAVKFTNNGGKVSVTLKKKADIAIISVTDTGCGMTKETGARIFDKFYQGDTSRSSEGNGLGLALVKKVINVLGGEISVQSELNKGSTFTVKIRGAIDEKNN
ncbi:MAG: HAMP domain-containing histidine kinase [Clostridiales bacterium]|nr:HAMP domain-containing histidine kinase [Clostridiales bacterium]